MASDGPRERFIQVIVLVCSYWVQVGIQCGGEDAGCGAVALS